MTTDEVKELMNKGLITQVINPTDVVNNMETEPGPCDYKLPTASADVLGGVKVGDGLDIDAYGKLHVTDSGSDYQLPIASNTTLGGVKVGDGIGIDSDGKLNINIGSGLSFIGEKVCVKTGNGLNLADDGTLCVTSGYTLPVATKTTLGGIKVGDSLLSDVDGTLNVNIGSAGLCRDSQGSLGVYCGGGLGINNSDGKLCIKTGGGLTTHPQSGMLYVKIGTGLNWEGDSIITVKYGDGLDIDENGKLYVTDTGGSDYELPIASSTTLGGVKIGTGLVSNHTNLSFKNGPIYKIPIGITSTGEIGINVTQGLANVKSSNELAINYGDGLDIDSDGKLKVKIGAGLEITNTNLCAQVATSNKFGVIKVGTGLEMIDGSLCTTGGGGGSDYELPLASESTLGGVMIGSGLTIDTDGKLGLSYASKGTSGLVKVGDGLYMKDNNWISVDCGDGLAIDRDGKLYVTDAGGSDYTLPIAGSDVLGGVMVGTDGGLNIDADGSLNIKLGSGLCYNNEYPGVRIKTGNGLGLTSDGTLYVDSNGSDYELPMAGWTWHGVLGGVKVGTSIDSSRCPYAKIGIDSTTGEIGLNYGAGLKTNSVMGGKYHSALEINYGDGLGIDSDGKLYVTGGGSGSTLPVASKNTLGGIKVGTGLTIDTDGKLGLSYASEGTSGLVKIGDGLYMKDNNWISVDHGDGLAIDRDGKLYVPIASKTTLGGIKIGTGFDSNCVQLGIDDKTGIACVSCGAGLKVNSNSQCIEVNIDYIYQQILTKLQNDGYLQ